MDGWPKRKQLRHKHKQSSFLNERMHREEPSDLMCPSTQGTMTRCGPYRGDVEGSPVAGGDAAAQQEHLVERSLAPYFAQRGFGDHRVLGEGADAQELEYLLAAERNPARAIR